VNEYFYQLVTIPIHLVVYIKRPASVIHFNFHTGILKIPVYRKVPVYRKIPVYRTYRFEIFLNIGIPVSKNTGINTGIPNRPSAGFTSHQLPIDPNSIAEDLVIQITCNFGYVIASGTSTGITYQKIKEIHRNHIAKRLEGAWLLLMRRRRRSSLCALGFESRLGHSIFTFSFFQFFCYWRHNIFYCMPLFQNHSGMQ